MSRADVVGLAMAGVLAIVALVLMAGCASEPLNLRIIGAEQLDGDTLRSVASALDRAPANPWPCVGIIDLTRTCRDTHGCYWPDDRAIWSTPEALGHELLHAAEACAGLPIDHLHLAEWWNP